MRTREPRSNGGQSRRAFLKKTSAAAAVVTSAGSTGALFQVYGANKSAVVSILQDTADPVVKQAQVQWAIGQLRQALEAHGIRVPRQSLEGSSGSDECVLIAGRESASVRAVLDSTAAILPDVPEAIGLFRGKASRQAALLACGSDTQGLVYATLELADRVRLAEDPLKELSRVGRVIQRPANQIRSVGRLFASEIEDKPWFNDRTFWEGYLTELATQRFNRFSLALGLGYDFPTGIRDAYFHFAYPFLLSVPGYEVRAAPLPDEERDGNLAMLRFISEETARRGLHFQLGLWTHAYKWVDSPNANYNIQGLTPETHAPYCRDALTALLAACPAISGVTFRIHGESGIAEGSYDFWKTVFDAVAHCGRRVEIDMHAKGMDDQMIELALATKQPVNISPKFWAEHLGLGYMQAAIRPQEMPPRDSADRGFFSRSSGSRRFLRYGYGDLLREDRRYGVLHRVWPGTQRLLLWASPDLAADYGRASSFCGSLGVEWFEPLSFKGRKGSGLPGGREGYQDVSLRPMKGDYEKYLYSYRVWGRKIYDPDCDEDEWRRFLRKDFGAGAPAVEIALREAGKILPLVTTAHCPSAASNNYWPEMYSNMAIANASARHPYSDTLSPKLFGAVSSLDPELFSRVDDFAQELLSGRPGARYSPAWVAASLDRFAAESAAALETARRKSRNPMGAEFRRMAADVAIQSGLGRFFAWKLRAAVCFALYERSNERLALERALEAYRKARAAWSGLAETARLVYRSDVTFGPGAFQRGHWLDRLPAIDQDIADMEKLLSTPGARNTALPQSSFRSFAEAIHAVLRAPPAPPKLVMPDFHSPPKSFRRGEPLGIEASPTQANHSLKVAAVQLRFRRVNQAEAWQSKEMEGQGTIFRAIIPGEYTDSAFPLQYHFELRETSGAAWLFPGLKPGWRGQPYFVVRQG